MEDGNGWVWGSPNLSQEQLCFIQLQNYIETCFWVVRTEDVIGSGDSGS